MPRGSGSSTDVASEHIVGGGALSQCVLARLTSFNVGNTQSMLQSGVWTNKHHTKFAHLMGLFTDRYGAGIVFGCQVGAHKQGFADARIADETLQTQKAMTLQNYLVALPETYLPMKVVHGPYVTELSGSVVCDPQLVLTAVQARHFAIKAAVMVVGILHIRTPCGRASPSISTRQEFVKEAVGTIKNFADLLKVMMPASERYEPVLALVGDCNLTRNLAYRAIAQLQPRDLRNTGEVWQVKTTRRGRSGDVCFVKGCPVVVFQVAVGTSCAERGMRNDCHDALGIVLEAQGRGFAHVHSKGHSRVGAGMRWVRTILRQEGGNLVEAVQRLRSRLLSTAATVLYESAREPQLHLVVSVMPEPFTALQQSQSRMDGGFVDDGSRRDLVPVEPAFVQPHIAEEQRVAGAEGREARAGTLAFKEVPLIDAIQSVFPAYRQRASFCDVFSAPEPDACAVACRSLHELFEVDQEGKVLHAKKTNGETATEEEVRGDAAVWARAFAEDVYGLSVVNHEHACVETCIKCQKKKQEAQESLRRTRSRTCRFGFPGRLSEVV